MKTISLLFSALFLVSSVQAAAPVPSPSPSATPNFIEKSRETVTESFNQVNQKLGLTKTYREQAKGYVLLNYSPLDLIIPSKVGATIGWVQDVDRTWELEYLRGSISVPFFIEDLGKFTDERLSIIRRSYFGSNSFNVSYGVTYFRMAIQIGSNLMGRIPAPVPYGIDRFSTESLGVNFGIGNRWSINETFVFGVDWISLAQPVATVKRKNDFLRYVSNARDRDDMDTAEKVMSYFPRFVLLKLQVGILF